MKEETRKRLMALTCKLILTEGQFDMDTYTGFVPGTYKIDEYERPKCGTACCIGGNLELARRTLRIRIKGLMTRATAPSDYLGSNIVSNNAYAIFERLYGEDAGYVFNDFDATPRQAVAAVMTGEKGTDLSPNEVRKQVRLAKKWIAETGV